MNRIDIEQELNKVSESRNLNVKRIGFIQQLLKKTQKIMGISIGATLLIGVIMSVIIWLVSASSTMLMGAFFIFELITQGYILEYFSNLSTKEKELIKEYSDNLKNDDAKIKVLEEELLSLDKEYKEEYKYNNEYIKEDDIEREDRGLIRTRGMKK